MKLFIVGPLRVLSLPSGGKGHGRGRRNWYHIVVRADGPVVNIARTGVDYIVKAVDPHKSICCVPSDW